MVVDLLVRLLQLVLQLLVFPLQQVVLHELTRELPVLLRQLLLQHVHLLVLYEDLLLLLVHQTYLLEQRQLLPRLVRRPNSRLETLRLVKHDRLTRVLGLTWRHHHGLGKVRDCINKQHLLLLLLLGW